MAAQLEIAERRIAKLEIGALSNEDSNRFLSFALSVKSQAIADMDQEIKLIRKRALQNEEVELQTMEAEYESRLNKDKKAHSMLAETLVTAHVEKELKALGATEALTEFRAKRDQRRVEVDKVFRINEDDDEIAADRINRAKKRRANLDAREDRDEERRKARINERKEEWNKELEQLEAEKKENEKKTRELKKLVRKTTARIKKLTRKSIAAPQIEEPICKEPEEVAQNPVRGPTNCSDHPIWAPSVIGDIYDRDSPLSPEPEQETREERKMRKVAEFLSFDAYFQHLLDTTEADEEIDIPKFGEEEQANYVEGDMYRVFDPDREVDNLEQMGYYVLPPPQATNAPPLNVSFTTMNQVLAIFAGLLPPPVVVQPQVEIPDHLTLPSVQDLIERTTNNLFPIGINNIVEE